MLLDQLVEPAHQPLAAGAPVGSQLEEAGRGAVRERSIRIEAGGELALQIVERALDGAGLGQQRRAVPPRVEEAPQHPRRPQARDHAPQLLVGEDGSDAGAVERVVDLGHVGRGERLACEVEGDRLPHLPQGGEDARPRRREGQRPRQPAPRGRGAADGERIEDAIPLQVGAGLGRTGVAEGVGRRHGGLAG